VMRVISGEVNVKDLSPMQTTWSYYNDVALDIEKLSRYVLQGKLVQTSYETSFKVSYGDKSLDITRKNTITGEIEETFHSERGSIKTAQTQTKISKSIYTGADAAFEKSGEDPIYQFTDKTNKINDGFEAFKKYMLSDMLVDTYLIALKLAQFGLTGESAPVIKGFHNIVQTLAKQADHENRFTENMRELGYEINSKILSEKQKSAKDSLLWFEAKVDESSWLHDKFRYGPCDRYGNCTCEIENRSKSCGNACFGLCGPNCDCWSWVCGDCVCHCFCFHHDYYCSCIDDLYYMCWNVWLWFDACC